MEVPEGFESMPEAGIRIGPPDLESLNLPLEIEVKLNNQLFERNLITWSDVRQRPDEIKAALSAALKLDFHKVYYLYGGKQ